ncbi:MAG: hypothetical protein A2599_02015 [Candidatus Staskawiczbacteria bacterium RIFOXYD1_FULL_39_28]|uniref:Uncharacterized protein n=1 Tax=Candidatus Staskawiczbacteria bacterium RIFOXYC1_FULL_38_18 TaxID=1802229 RepID=A0A1G2JB53_9BACT|nr:MAG: hypothetical protein A2401_02655 [Candidatus Staskawiczbacteria bacterium RIFOXYC1_FULL_38_18]OGZ91804.1 MAG: hypothetical protein A2599_02015 [Candidatus Staskawiczbacteria bacterium RIFOXYD1_FULL_39_28]
MPKNMDSFPSNEGGENRPISELSTEEIERILQERKNSQRREKGEEFVFEREAHRNMFLQDLGDGITTGEPQSNKKSSIRGAEYVGLYKDGQYIGDIVSEGNLTGITDREFQDKAYELVAKSLGKKVGAEREKKPRVDINIDADARKLMDQMNMVLSGDKLTLQNDQMDLDLYDNGSNQKIEISKIDETKILLSITEKGGKVIEYVIDAGRFIPDSRRVKL